MSYLLSPVFQGPQLDDNGALLVGGKLYWYLAGTTTPATVYQDAGGGAAFTNPIILDARGESAAPIYLQSGQAYKAVLKDSTDVQLNVIDNIQGVNDVSFSTGTFTSINVDSTGNPAKIYQGASGDLEIATNQTSGTQGVYRMRNNLFQTPLGFSVDASGNLTATGGSLTGAGALAVTGDVTYGSGSLTSSGGLVTSKGSLTSSGLTMADASVQPTAAFTGFRNRLINGDFRIAQRGAITLPGYPADRWGVSYVGTQPTAALVTGANFSAQTSTVLQITGAAGNTSCSVWQRVESLNIRDLAGLSATVSGWLYQTSGSTVNIAVSYVYPTTTTDDFTSRTTGATQNVSVPSGVWTAFSVTWTLASGVLRGLQLQFDTPAIAATKVYSFGNIQIEKGPTATQFEQRPYGAELALCQRYYQKIGAGCMGWAIGTTAAYLSGSLAVPMRAIPSVATPSATITISDGANPDFTQSVAHAALVDSDGSRLVFQANNFAGLTQFRPYYFKLTATVPVSAEL